MFTTTISHFIKYFYNLFAAPVLRSCAISKPFIVSLEVAVSRALLQIAYEYITQAGGINIREVSKGPEALSLVYEGSLSAQSLRVLGKSRLLALTLS